MPFSELFAASMDLLMLVLNSISPYFSLRVSIAVLLTFVRSTIVGSTPMRFSFGLVFALTSCVRASRGLQTVHTELLRLHGYQHSVRSGKGIDKERSEGRQAVDQHEVIRSDHIFREYPAENMLL